MFECYRVEHIVDTPNVSTDTHYYRGVWTLHNHVLTNTVAGALVMVVASENTTSTYRNKCTRVIRWKAHLVYLLKN